MEYLVYGIARLVARDEFQLARHRYLAHDHEKNAHGELVSRVEEEREVIDVPPNYFLGGFFGHRVDPPFKVLVY